MPGQGRLAISRLRVPNLDSVVIAAAGNLLSIGTPRHRVDTVFIRSQYTNQQKPGGKTWGKNLHAQVPGHRALLNVHLETFYMYAISSVYLSATSYLFEWFILQALKKGTYFFCYCSSIFIKKLTVASGRSPGTRKRTGLYLLNLYDFQ